MLIEVGGFSDPRHLLWLCVLYFYNAICCKNCSLDGQTPLAAVTSGKLQWGALCSRSVMTVSPIIFPKKPFKKSPHTNTPLANAISLSLFLSLSPGSSPPLQIAPPPFNPFSYSIKIEKLDGKFNNFQTTYFSHKQNFFPFLSQ